MSARSSRTFKVLTGSILVILGVVIASWILREHSSTPTAESQDQDTKSSAPARPSPWELTRSTSVRPGPQAASVPAPATVAAPAPPAGATTSPRRGVPPEVTNGRLITTSTSDASPDGVLKRVSLHETDFKYPLLRMEEQVRRLPSGAEVLIKRNVMVADHLMVTAKPRVSEQDFKAWLGQHQLTVRRRIPNAPLYLVAINDPSVATYDAALQALAQADSPAAYADPDYIVQNQAQASAPNDPSFAQQWALSNTGQTGGIAGADINALTAWSVTEGSSNVTVAVIDTGMDLDHPDLEPNLWTNDGETPGNGVDDDANGYIDDMHGWDFVSNDATPDDEHGHGSHTGGTVGAVGRNSIGVTGVSHHVKLMPLKFLDASGSGADSDAIEAIYYATAKGVFLSSNSWGGGDFVQAMQDAISHAGTQGVGFVAAAGNDGLDNDLIPNYPSNYLADNLIAVAATDASDQLSWFSNYGANKVHLAAPGENVLSTYRDGGYVHSSGTSMATPHVAGAAALLKAANPTMSFAQIKAALLAKTDLIAGLTGKVSTGGRLDVGNAIDLATSAYPVLVKTTVVDGGAPGTTGNADGIISPGETAALTLEVQNLGGLPTGPLQATVTMNTADPKVTLGNTTQTFGVVPAAARQANTGTPLTITVTADHLTPASLPLSLTFTDGAGVNRVEEATLEIYTVSQISGRVTNVGDGSGLTGATVHFTGPVTRTATTTTDGTYSASVVDGSYAVHASAAGFVSSAPQTVVVPPSAENVNMALGYSALQVTPSVLAATVEEDDLTTQTLTLQNNGNVPLTWKLVETPKPDNAATGRLLAGQVQGLKPLHPAAFLPSGPAVQALEEGPGPSRLLPPRPGLHALDNNTATYPYLPFADGFEDGTYNKWFESWTDAHREVVSNTAAEGAKSFRFNMAGAEDHFCGVHQEFEWAQQPGHVSFWVRTAKRDLATAYMVLCDVSGNYLVDFIWFFAHPNGRFYLNADVGGNQLVAYDKDTWYHIEFRNVNWTTKTFDYFVNGTVVQAGVPFRNPALANQCIAAFAYNYSGNVNAWYDGVEFSNDAIDWMSLSQSSGTIAPGGSAVVTVTYDATKLSAGTYEGLVALTTNDPTSTASTLPVTLQVTPTTNTVPVASSNTLSTSEDSTTIFNLSGSDADNDTLEYYITQLPAKGRLFQTFDGFEPAVPITTAPTLVLSSNRQLIYLPETNEHGTPYTSFTFTTRDKRSESAPATVTIQVSSVPDAPVLEPDVFASMPGQPIASLNVLGNDYSPDNVPLTVQSFTQPSQGTVTANPDGTLAFQPAGAFLSGSTSFTCTVTDGTQNATTTVTVHVGDLRGGTWPSLGGNSHRSGQFPAVLNGPLQLRWTQSLQGVPTMPVVANNRVYVTGHRTDGSDEIMALHLDTGLPTWSRDETISGGINPPLAYGSSLYYVLTDPGYASSITALDIATGARQWYGTFNPTSSELGKSLLGSHGLIHMPGGSGPRIYGVLPYAPSAAYITTLPGAQTGTPTEGAGLILAATGGAIHALDAINGAHRWTFRPNAAVLTTNSTVVWEAGDAVVNLEGTLYCVATHQAPFTRWSSESNKHLFTPAVRQGIVYAAFEYGTPGVRVFDRRTGTLLRTIPLPVTPASQPLFTQDRVIVSTAAATHIISLADGTVQQTLPKGGLLVPADNNLIIVDTTNPGVSAYGAPPVITLGPASASSPNAIPWRIGTTVPEGQIHFTLDGTTPTSQSPTIANLGASSSLRTTTVKAVGIHAGLTGPVTTTTFTVGDSNTNQLPDWWEQQHGSVRPSPVTVLDPAADDDGDLRNNLDEFLAGTNPNQSDALVTPLQSGTNGAITVTWPSEVGHFYSVQTSLDLKTWDKVATTTLLPGTGTVMTWQDTGATGQQRKFYRVVITTP